MISTRDLSLLPDVDALRRLMQSLAMLDAILSREWEYRYFSFNHRWSAGEQMGSMRDGQGGHYFALFNAAGCWLKGFDPRAPMSSAVNNHSKAVAGMFDGVPAEFQACIAEPAFVANETTFCIWRRYGEREWQRGPVRSPAGEEDQDGSVRLLRHLDGQPQTYREWATEYYQRDVSLNAVRSIFAHSPLTPLLVTELNPETCISELIDDADVIGYPLADGTLAAG